jgi:YegS/Rv2252/BmrU family lipid kinase
MRVLLVINPEAGGGKGKEIGRLVREELNSRSCQFLEVQTAREKRGKGVLDSAWSEFQRSFSQPPELLMVVGGDGTLNEVVNEAGNKATLAFIPAGTANVFAKEMGLPDNVSEAVAVALRKRKRKIDVGLVNQRKFLLMTGVGMDAEVIEKVGEAEKKVLGKAPFVVKAFWEGIKFKPPKIKVKCRDREEEGSFLVVANSSFYGGGLRIAPWALLDDGWLEICLFKGKNAWQFFHFAFSVFLSQQAKLPTFDFFRAREIEVFSDREVLVQCDGEVIGTTPVKISLLPGYLEVAAPG